MSGNNMLKENKICFIICSNNETYLKECLFYINRLSIPVGYEVNVISVWDAKSMAGGYNEGMAATDAKYKIYLHQDVFIIYKKFLYSILNIFNADSSIGMIGMVGAPKIPVGGVMWYGYREGQLYGYNKLEEEYDTYNYHLKDGLHEVQAVDGLLIATNRDIIWRENKFDGWDFYDISQSFEFRKAGYKIVVPEQFCPWCKHDDGVLNLTNYNKYRKICLQEYPEYFNPKRFDVKRSELEQPKSEENLYIVIIARNQFKQVKECINSILRFSTLDESRIIVVDNGSEDGLRHWLKKQNYNYIICGEIKENYAAILNEVIRQFVNNQDILVIQAELLFLPFCISRLYSCLNADKKVGAVCGRKILEDSKQIEHYEETIKIVGNYLNENNLRKKREITGLPLDVILLNNKMLKELKKFDECFETAENAILDYAYRGKVKGYRYYELEDSFFYKREKNIRNFLEDVDVKRDKEILKEKWKI